MTGKQAEAGMTGKKAGAAALRGFSEKELEDLGDAALRLSACSWISDVGDRGAEGCRDGLYPLFSYILDATEEDETVVKTPVAALKGQKCTEHWLDLNRFLLAYGKTLPPDMRRLAKAGAFSPVKNTPVLDEAVRRQLKRAYPAAERRGKGRIRSLEQAGMPRWELEYNFIVRRNPKIRIYVEGELEEAMAAGRFRILYELTERERRRTEGELERTVREAPADQQYADRLRQRLKFYTTLKGQLSPYAEARLGPDGFHG